ncbi:MAG: hypothetical protein Ct9H300mP18_08700 [Candidatus Neomarinimicrobiota bacterium]|nr:MAG: hypothetical protein Ct9H300mP18_08700 [Candidatus Neomarinimicrobiota bacterium]
MNFTFLKKKDAYFDYAVVVEPHSVSQGLIHVFTYAFISRYILYFLAYVSLVTA